MKQWRRWRLREMLLWGFAAFCVFSLFSPSFLSVLIFSPSCCIPPLALTADFFPLCRKWLFLLRFKLWKSCCCCKKHNFFALLSTNPILIDQNVQLIIPSLSTFWLVCMVCGSQPDAHQFPWEIDRGILKLPTLYFKCVEEFPRDITFFSHDIINEIGLKWLRWSIHKLIYRKLNGH